MNLVKILQEIPTIESETVVLRKIRMDDALELYHYYNNKNVYQYLDWNGPSSTEHAEEIIQGLDPFLEKEWIINNVRSHEAGSRLGLSKVRAC